MATSADRRPPALEINPPLLNSANPWATTLDDLQALFDCPSTGAVTTRTSLIRGFPHDPKIHQYTFFDPATHASGEPWAAPPSDSACASLNNLGYSPITLAEYLGFIRTISDGLPAAVAEGPGSRKLFIVSVTGTPEEVGQCYGMIAEVGRNVRVPLAMEVNLSCPNIAGKPPPAYEAASLREFLRAITAAVAAAGPAARIPFGLKTPPYTHAGQFDMLIGVLREAGDDNEGICPVSFLTATNTLGSCLVLGGEEEGGEATDTEAGMGPRLAGLGVGGMAGAPLHPLALGNVRTLRRMLDESEVTRPLQIIGIGGVEDAAGYKRMRSAGAVVIGVGTALGRLGVGVFKKIEEGLAGKWV